MDSAVGLRQKREKDHVRKSIPSAGVIGSLELLCEQ